jgi:hypothetical protein
MPAINAANNYLVENESVLTVFLGLCAMLHRGKPGAVQINYSQLVSGEQPGDYLFY